MCENICLFDSVFRNFVEGGGLVFDLVAGLDNG